jgi:ubiquinone/menaquinone biosynthesis C-methylase UbiE
VVNDLMEHHEMKYDPIKEEIKWWGEEKDKDKSKKKLPPRHHFAHSCIRLKLYDTLLQLGCNSSSLILDIGCGSGEDTIYIQKASQNIIGVDIANLPLKKFTSKGFQGVLCDVKRLPFQSDSFEYVISSGLLHHLIGQGDLKEYLEEFVRVTREGGYVIALEPNVFHPSGILMNTFNTIKPGVTGLVPHERALSPLYLNKNFITTGLKNVKCVSASYVWNRFPLSVSKFISKNEEMIRFKKPLNLFGWFVLVYGQKKKVDRR